jgi:KUP system potassium uptake protein
MRSRPRGGALFLSVLSYYTRFRSTSRELKPSPTLGMPSWQDHLFIGLARSASDATDFFQIPTGRVVEVGTQVAV